VDGDNQVDDPMNAAYYAAKANAWFSTQLEHDKSLLVLSAGAIGLLATLLTTGHVKSIHSLFMFGASMLSFVVCLCVVLLIYKRNAKYIEALISGLRESDPALALLDTVAIASFLFGVVLLSIIGLATATEYVVLKEDAGSMSNKAVSTQCDGAAGSPPQAGEMLKKGFNGAQNIAPPTKGETTTTSGSGGNGQGASGTATDSGKK
jgi:hypothetical protein